MPGRSRRAVKATAVRLRRKARSFDPGRALAIRYCKIDRPGYRIAGAADFRLGLSGLRRRRLVKQTEHERACRDRSRDQQQQQYGEASTQRPEHKSRLILCRHTVRLPMPAGFRNQNAFWQCFTPREALCSSAPGFNDLLQQFTYPASYLRLLDRSNHVPLS